MKKCPVCKNTIRSFMSWAVDPNIFKLDCQSCAAKLKLTHWFKFHLFIMFLVLVSMIPYAESILTWLNMDPKSRFLRIAIILPPAIIFGGLFFTIAQYKVDTAAAKK